MTYDGICPRCKQHNPAVSWDGDEKVATCGSCGAKLEGIVRRSYDQLLPEIRESLLARGRPKTREKYHLAASTMCHLEARMDFTPQERSKIEQLSGRMAPALPLRPTGEWLVLRVTNSKDSHGIGVVMAFGEGVPSCIKTGSSVGYSGKCVAMPDLNISMVRYRDVFGVIGKNREVKIGSV